jgi:hypothetical protein
MKQTLFFIFVLVNLSYIISRTPEELNNILNHMLTSYSQTMISNPEALIILVTNKSNGNGDDIIHYYLYTEFNQVKEDTIYLK